MSRLRSSIMAAVVAGSVLGACARENTVLPAGTYSGSTASDQEITVEIGDKVKVNGKKARRRAQGRILAEGLPGSPELTCRPQKDGDELRCQLRAGDAIEELELLRL